MKLLLILSLLFSSLFSNGQKPVTNYNTHIDRANNVEIKIDKQYIIIGNGRRIIQNEGLNNFFKDYPDKNISIQFAAIGSPNKEMFNVAEQIAAILKNNGYNNFKYQLNTAFGVPIPDGIVYKYDSAVKVIVFEIPPID